MTDIQEVRKNFIVLQEQMIIMQATINEFEEKERVNKPWPLRGDKYYSITGLGDIISTINCHRNRDNYRVKVGNCFRTKEEAEKARGISNLNIKIRQALKEANGDWVEDYRNISQVKWSVHSYNHIMKRANVDLHDIFEINKYPAKTKQIFLDLFSKYGEEEVCRAFGVIG